MSYLLPDNLYKRVI